MVLNNKFLIDLINSQRSSKIEPGKDFDFNDVFTYEWDDRCKISFEDYLNNQEDESFLADIKALDLKNAQFGLVIEDVTKLSPEDAEKLKGDLRIYIYDSEDEKMANNSYYYLEEYIDSSYELEALMDIIDQDEPNELKKAKQILKLLHNQYKHKFPDSKDIQTGIRHSQNMYGCLYRNEAVCAGGAHTYRAMCTLAGIKCRTVDSDILISGSFKEKHVSNQICINGEWGIVDVEFDKSNPEANNFFFCSLDEYEELLKDHNMSYEKSSLGNGFLPTNITVPRDYIEKLGTKDEFSINDVQEKTLTGEDQLRTLAINEIVNDDITKEDMIKSSSMEREEETHEQDNVK